jgi:lipopolysaccharide/colanic/teichoic acid biosynthesis glycosyltransferase
MTGGRLYQRGGKRLLDIVGAMALLVAALPIVVLAALAIRVTLGWPVFFTERRAGRHGVPFILWKFRSMTNDGGPDGRLLPDADRLTPLGRFLRRSSVDELPELVHVLTGTMSLVGPRPLPVAYLTRYSAEQARRLEVRPGLTGVAQVRGRNALDWDERLAMDTWYVDHCTVWLDLEVLLRTVAVVCRGHGVSQPGHATMSEFAGTGGRT